MPAQTQLAQSLIAALDSAQGIVRANSFTLAKRQNRISRPLIFLHFSGSI
jgi:hypothetical protein